MPLSHDMASRLFIQIVGKRRKNESPISQPYTMPTSLPSNRDSGAVLKKMIYEHHTKGTFFNGRMPTCFASGRLPAQECAEPGSENGRNRSEEHTSELQSRLHL